jgi:AraC family transcriptional regulator
MQKDILKIQKLVGDITPEQIRYVDCAVTDNLGVFMPIAGPCFYAITPEHIHPSYSFVCTFDSFCKININGSQLESQPGKLIAISPHIPHQEVPGTIQSRYIAIMVNREYFAQSYKLYNHEDPPVFKANSFKSSQRLVAELKEFMTEYEEASVGYECLLEAGAMKIVHLIIRRLLDVSGNDERILYRMSINRAIEHINIHMGNRLTVSDLAHEAHMSPSHFTRVFKKETGIAPMEYVARLRLDRAKRMLIAGDKTITEIAIECGFGSSSYFTQCFTNHYSVTPSELKKQFIGHNS